MKPATGDTDSTPTGEDDMMIEISYVSFVVVCSNISLLVYSFSGACEEAKEFTVARHTH